MMNQPNMSEHDGALHMTADSRRQTQSPRTTTTTTTRPHTLDHEDDGGSDSDSGTSNHDEEMIPGGNETLPNDFETAATCTEDKDNISNEASAPIKSTIDLPVAQPSTGSRLRSRSGKGSASAGLAFIKLALAMRYAHAQAEQVCQLGRSHARQASVHAIKLAVYDGHVQELAALLAHARWRHLLVPPADLTANDKDGQQDVGERCDREHETAALRQELSRAVAGLDAAAVKICTLVARHGHILSDRGHGWTAQAGYLGLMAKLINGDGREAQAQLSKMGDMVKYVPELKNIVDEGIEAYASRKGICLVKQRE